VIADSFARVLEIARTGASLRDPEDFMNLRTALALMRPLRRQVDELEEALLRAARSAGLSWQQLAEVLDLDSRQAAEQRYRRLAERQMDVPTVWIENLHNLRCPQCGHRLVAQAGEFRPLGRSQPVYVQEGGSARCPQGHELPAQAELYRWRDEHGYEVPTPGTPVRRVPPP
jgi:hypothetical protein